MEDSLRSSLARVADEIARYRANLSTARVTPEANREQVLAGLDPLLPDSGDSIETVLDRMVAGATPGLMASAGPRYFGFVVGGSVDAALAAEMMAVGWDQNAFNEATSPAAIAFENLVGSWLKDLFGIPSTASVGFVTGAQGANTVGLAAGRWKVLKDHGWDVGVDGLFGAPRVRVIVGEERHATIDRSLRLLGLGERSMTVIPAREDGSLDPDSLADALASEPGAPTIVCAQAGNVNTGAFDDLRSIGNAVNEHGGWLHVDGAFGLWAATAPSLRHLVDGIELAHSWGCDGHKWLNVPYDSGYAFCSDPDVHATSMAYTAAYLTGQGAARQFGGGDFVAESSRRARGFATWAALRSLGRDGVAEIVERCCALALRLADGIEAVPGMSVANQVVLNQVLIRVGDEDLTLAVERIVQEEGVCWLGSTVWRGQRLLRVSVSNWSTTESDIDLSVDSISRAREKATTAR